MQTKRLSATRPPEVLRLLAHDLRWQLVAELARSDRRVGELATLVARPQNLVSYHLGQLRYGGLVDEQRSAADGRDIYYRLDLERLAALYRAGGGALHPALALSAGEPEARETIGIRRVLFLCTHNSARSQMAEALLRAEGIDRIRVASAGSEPSRVHPLAVRAMAERGIDIGQQVSKSMDEPARLPWDLVITVCDRVREVCPAFPSQTTLSHWSIRDPAAATGSEPVQLEVFRQTAADLARRVRYLALTIDEGGARWNT